VGPSAASAKPIVVKEVFEAVRMFSPGRFLIHLSKVTFGHFDPQARVRRMRRTSARLVSWPTYRVIRATNTGCPQARVVRMLVKRAYKVQIPCHSKFQCSFHGLRAEAPSPCTILELPLEPLRQMGALK
jgi:hypothetical protein